MPLAPGLRLGVYEIQGSLGAGGMGEVYRARDVALNRDVALKILPEAFAFDPDRLARFRREAQVLASLNHPNIGAIYGFEESHSPPKEGGGTMSSAVAAPALVLELVEGPTLADRIARGAIPLDEALPIAKQIAEALEAAHEQGIIHRDLKPANIKVRPDGAVKVLDFGLAKALDPDAPSGTHLSRSPTITAGGTMPGAILGTAAYMSPEQARGKPVDKRGDIWAFGCVLFEMLSGRRAFEGDDASVTLAAIMLKEPDWAAIPRTAPSGLHQLLRTCLEKHPKRRLQAIGDARLEIERLLDGGPSEQQPPATTVLAPQWQRVLPWAIAAVLGAALGLVLLLWVPWRPATSPTARVETSLGADVSLITGASVALSPDGRLLVFVGQGSSGHPQLYVRPLGQLQATAVAGTTGASHPFFSPDGQWVAFFADGKLKKIGVTGGATVTLCDAPNGRGGWWAEDGTIVLMPTLSGTGAVLQRVSSAGGNPEALTTLGEGEVGQRWPQVLPGGRALLYTAAKTVANYTDASIVVQPLPSGPRKVLVRGGYFGRFLPSGHLAYVRDTTLFVAPFDLSRLEVTGPFQPAIDRIRANDGLGSALFTASDNGTAVFAADPEITPAAPIVWLDRSGKTSPLRGAPASWSNPQFAPDGRRLALQITDGRLTDVWLYDWERDTLTRATPLEEGNHTLPMWTPDARRITFNWFPSGSAGNLYWRRADGVGEAQRLTDSRNPQQTGAWHPSGTSLVFFELSRDNSYDLMLLPLDGDETSGWKPGTATAILNSAAAEMWPAFSPDGRWMAYQSDESGRLEVFVRAFPGPGGKWQVSTDGGTYPVWSRARQELLYATPDNRINVVSYTADADSFSPGKPRQWSEVQFSPRLERMRFPIGSLGTDPGGRPFDLHPDGERVAIAPAESQASGRQDKVVFVFNFFDELRRIAPVAGR